jgi:cyclic beta-1,2-glucan synthetase
MINPLGRTTTPEDVAPWTDYTIEYPYGSSMYLVRVLEPARAQPGAQEITRDGRVVEGGRIRLADDGQRHSVTVRPAS